MKVKKFLLTLPESMHTRIKRRCAGRCTLNALMCEYLKFGERAHMENKKKGKGR